MYFVSRRDWWLTLVIWGAVLVSISATLIGARTDPAALPIIALPTIVMMTLVSWIWLGTGYTITPTELLVQGGPFRWRVPLWTIRSVRDTRNPLSAPALSLQRLEITYDPGRTILVSPNDRDAFLNLLRERCPQAVFEVA